ncbi:MULTISPECIES: glutaredoxin family protein [unclassified Fusibacter]|uniref:glutaredoxin family protein n=1 Tax=unclassified Fusibacter TaxID=2624464 RepID=UPI0013E9117E|nr:MULTISPECIES: glutaredoxin family protein [unclassified Fusibacter]MCK8058339.1 glutaredoxin family protein [Fusibacter sp. A2]NPE20922.1 glutaredoxin family protein [Fusibacter sp. A1]
MKDIIMYTTSTCPHCKTAKQALTNAGYRYIERNASTDPSAQREMQTMGLMGVPAFNIGGEVFTGFDFEKIKRLVDYVIMPCPKCEKKLRLPKGKDKLRITCPHCEHQFTLLKK